MTANRTDVDILDDFCARSRLPSEAETITLLRSYARNNRRTEDNRVDLKEAHSDSPAGWAQTCKDVVAMHNSGGGVLLFGVKDSGERIGINASLMAHFDPTNVNNKLRRCHISGQVRTSFIERFYYGKVYGFLFVHAGGTLLVFDTDLQVSNKGGKRTLLLAPVLSTSGGVAPVPQLAKSSLRQL